MYELENHKEAAKQPDGRQIFIKAFLETPERSLSLIDLFALITNLRWLLLGGMIAGGIAGLLAGFFLTPTYQAKVVLEYVDQDSSSPGSIGGAFGGVASLAGLSFGQSSGRAYSIGRLQSQNMLMEYMRQFDVLKIIYADRWDATEQKFLADSSGRAPTLLEGYKKFREDIVSVSTDTKTQLISLEIEWKDPAQTAIWANGYTRFTSDILRQEKLKEANRTLGLLSAELATAQLPELRAAIVKLIQDQIRQKMLASVPEMYGFRIVDKAITPERPIKPKRWLLVAAGSCLVGVIVLFAGLALHINRAWRKANDQKK
jgi:uncharacterized protein involved in exopolysaccharide biosynthesis